MQIIVNNELDESKLLYKVVASIPKENYWEFYQKIAEKRILDNTKRLVVEIKDRGLIGDNDAVFKFRTEKIHENVLGLIYTNDYFAFDLYRFIPSENRCWLESKLNPLWQQFLTENLGEKLYKKLLAEKIKYVIDQNSKEADGEYKNLVAKINIIKKQKEEIKQQEVEFKKDFADVLDEKGNVLPIEDTDIKNV